MVTVECIARGYLAGLGLDEYEKHGAVSGVPLPAGLVEGSRLPEPVFTPTTKAPPGQGHDEFMTYDEVVARARRRPHRATLRDLTLEIYRRGAAIAAEQGVIIADTKLEFGHAADGTLVLADEVLTPDSSRFWPADGWAPGRPQHCAGQAVRPRLGDRHRVGQAAAGARGPAGDRRGDPRPLRRRVRAPDRHPLVALVTPAVRPSGAAGRPGPGASPGRGGTTAR